MTKVSNPKLRGPIVWLSLVLMGCSSEPPTDVEPVPLDSAQAILFHSAYENYAWGYQNSGWYVDREGNVWSMSPARIWDEVSTLMAGEVPTETYARFDLEAGYLNVRDSLLLEIGQEELAEMALLIRGASAGTYSDPEMGGADIGLMLAGALLLDPATDEYRKIVLAVSGDWRIVNQSTAAGELYQWFVEVAQRVATR